MLLNCDALSEVLQVQAMGITLLDEYTDEIRRSLRLILSGGTTIDNPKFGPNARSRRLLYFSGGPEPELWIALCHASLGVGSAYCFLIRISFFASEVGNHYSRCNDDAFMQSHYQSPFLWQLDCNEPMQLFETSSTDDIDQALSVEYAIFSFNGTWGLIKPIGRHAILVGIDEFIAEVEKTVPDLNQQVEIFLGDLYLESQETPPIDVDAVGREILPIYGEQESESLLRKSGLV